MSARASKSRCPHCFKNFVIQRGRFPLHLKGRKVHARKTCALKRCPGSFELATQEAA